jgi:hypothetical protein
MKSKYLISTKSSGLCFNIMRLIILTEVAANFKRDLIFLTKKDHIPILRKFNSKCTFIPYIDKHTERFNNFTRNKNIHIVYDLKYIKFLKETYLDSMFGSSKISEFKFINGCKYDIEDSCHNFLLIDYNDGRYDTDIINSINIPMFDPGIYYNKYNKDILTINIKNNNPDNSRIYEFWDEILPLIKSDYKKTMLLISGNNDIKQYLGEKHNCLYEILETETNFSNVRGNNIIRGKAEEIYNDLIICATTDFLPFVKLRADYREILDRYIDLNFVTEKVEKFDILAEYLSNFISIPES